MSVQEPGLQQTFTSSRQVSIRLESERRIGAGWVAELRCRLLRLSNVLVDSTVPRIVPRIGISKFEKSFHGDFVGFLRRFLGRGEMVEIGGRLKFRSRVGV